MKIAKPEIGDRIKFRAVTRWSNQTLVRVVNGYWSNGFPTVRAHGCADFVVKPKEILEVIPKTN